MAWKLYGNTFCGSGHYAQAEECFYTAASIKEESGSEDKDNTSIVGSMVSSMARTVHRGDFPLTRLDLLELVENTRGVSDGAIDNLINFAEAQQEIRSEVINDVRTTLKQLGDHIRT